jgi:hypothetical protein
MGAATALLHGERDPSIAGMILDSAFADLQMLAEEMVEKGRQSGLIAPSFIVKIAIRMIRGSVLKTAAFDIRQLSPIEHADRCFIPTMFVAAAGDEFVPPHHRYEGSIYIAFRLLGLIVAVNDSNYKFSFLFLTNTATRYMPNMLVTKMSLLWMVITIQTDQLFCMTQP